MMKKCLIGAFLILAFCCISAFAQVEPSKYNFVIGGGPGFPHIPNFAITTHGTPESIRRFCL